MVVLQVPLPGLARDFNQLTPQEKDFIAYFSTIDLGEVTSLPTFQSYFSHQSHRRNSWGSLLQALKQAYHYSCPRREHLQVGRHV